MNLKKVVSFGTVFAYVAMLVAGVIMFGSIAHALLTSNQVNVFPMAIAIIVLWSIRVVLALWLRSLGGTPDEHRQS